MSQVIAESNAYNNIFEKKSFHGNRPKIVSISSQKMKKGQVLQEHYNNMTDDSNPDPINIKRSTITIKSRNNNVNSKLNDNTVHSNKNHSVNSALSH